MSYLFQTKNATEKKSITSDDRLGQNPKRNKTSAVINDDYVCLVLQTI